MTNFRTIYTSFVDIGYDSEQDEDTNDKFEKYKEKIAGTILCLASSGLYLTNYFLINSNSMSVSDLLLLRSLLQTLLFSIIVHQKGLTLLPDDIVTNSMFIGKGLLGSVILFSSLFCVSLMPVTDTISILLVGIVLKLILTSLVQGEGLNGIHYISLSLSMLGLILKVQFHDLSEGRYQEGAAIAVVTILATCALQVMQTQEQVSMHLVQALWTGLSCLLISIFGSMLDHKAKLISFNIILLTWKDLGMMLLASLGGLLGTLLYMKAETLVSSKFIRSLSLADLVQALIGQYLVTGYYPGVVASIGHLLVGVSVLFIGFQEELISFVTKEQEVVPPYFADQTSCAKRPTETSRLLGSTS